MVFVPPALLPADMESSARVSDAASFPWTLSASPPLSSLADLSAGPQNDFDSKEETTEEVWLLFASASPVWLSLCRTWSSSFWTGACLLVWDRCLFYICSASTWVWTQNAPHFILHPSQVSWSRWCFLLFDMSFQVQKELSIAFQKYLLECFCVFSLMHQNLCHKQYTSHLPMTKTAVDHIMPVSICDNWVGRFQLLLLEPISNKESDLNLNLLQNLSQPLKNQCILFHSWRWRCWLQHSVSRPNKNIATV